MINVTKSYLPDLNEYLIQLKRIWENEWLTNRGELVKELEVKIKNHLSSPNLILMNNGTIPIQIALQLLGNQGEIITTPFSYVATTSAIVWQNCKPVFVDIDPDYLTIDESKIESLISDKTTCILATNVFGNTCNFNAIEKLAKKYNLKIIYDSAHCFGVKYEGKSVFEYGDISTCSFHATKLFHTGEGGALFTNNESLFNQSFYSHNFGHDGPSNFFGLGINGKISELQAAMGLCVLSNIDNIYISRKVNIKYYIDNIKNSKIRFQKIREGTTWNYSYFPIIFDNEDELLKVQKSLNKENIFPRRYFYPSLNLLPYVSNLEMPISEKISKTIMCLPLYYGLEESIQFKICSIINNSCI
jgi:dTDP-4-amino-4,6-dideoxygalactose transaminase